MTDAAAVAERRYRADEQPTVVCVMLVNGRPEMVKRAIDSFVSQTYAPKRLYIYDTSDDKQPIIDALPDGYPDSYGILYHGGHAERRTIGALRNWANHFAASDGADIIAHWDSDDWSHPRRLEEQVALLQASGKQCVGYRELLFWDTRPGAQLAEQVGPSTSLHKDGEAWLYRNDDARWVAGASMLYTREAWEACPFDDAPHEDQRWWMRNAEKCLGVSALPETLNMVQMPEGYAKPMSSTPCKEPRMIAQMHGGNTEAHARAAMLAGSQVWRRATEWDKFCERTMAL